MKQCVNCGRELPDDASFCPWCETEQQEPRQALTPRVWRRRTLLICSALAVLLTVGALLYAALRPRVFDAGGPELTYRGYHVLLSFSFDTPRPAQGSKELTIPSHADYASPSQLCAYRSNDTVNAGEDFMALVARVTLDVEPRDGAVKMEYDVPEANAAFPEAALMSSVYYDSTCGTNDVTWTVWMKNGDRLILRQYIAVTPQPEKSYYYTDYDMSTMEALQALLKEIEETQPPEMTAHIYLAPVTYSGRLTLSTRGYYFYGSADRDAVTTFADTVTVETAAPDYVNFHGVRFSGSGGTGLIDNAGVVLEQCSFSGWDIGATAGDGGFLSTHSCSFVGNGVGLQYNTGKSRLQSEECNDCLFEDNDIAVQLVRFPTDYFATFSFPRTVFRGNREDVRNESTIVTDCAESVFE